MATTPVTLGLIQIIAKEAIRDLGTNAAKGAHGRPTVEQLNRTIDRLASIVRLVAIEVEG